MEDFPLSLRARGPRADFRRVMCIMVALALGGGLTGCTRNFFRQRADRDVDKILEEKDQYPQWAVEQFHVYPDPRARFADPTDPDHPPMPPDDPAARHLSPNPQKPGKAGSARVDGTGYLDLLATWDRENREEASAEANTAAGDKPGEAPKSETARPADAATTQATLLTPERTGPYAQRPFRIKLDQAVQLGLINSREYQDRREDLYLVALPVTLERFAFSAQFFAAETAIRERTGKQTPEGQHNRWRLNSDTGMAKLFSTGALLLFNIANQTVIELTGPLKHTVSQSTLSLDLIQPLLRGGGRAVTLEPLTQSERNLLYQIRSFARFRKEFYVAIAGGGGGSITGGQFVPTGVISATTVAAGAGVGGSGIIPGVIPPVTTVGNPGLQINPGTSGRVNLNTAIPAPVSGYLTTLLESAQMLLDQYNIEKLEGFLRLAEATKEGGDISQLQVDQFEQQLLRGRSQLLTDQQQYLDSLDRFKLQLGLPTDLALELDDAPFRPLTRQFQRFEDVFNQYIAAGNEAQRFGGPQDVAKVRGELRRLLTTSAIVRGTRFATRIAGRWDAWAKLSDNELAKRLAQLGEERRRLLDKRADLEVKGEALSAPDQQRVDELDREILLGDFEKALRNYEAQSWKNMTEPARSARQQREFRYVINGYLVVLIEARNERIDRTREQWPELAPLCVNGVDLLKVGLNEGETAVTQAALVNRLDLMNVRGQLVDAWRQLAVFANALLGTFNVQYHLDTFTPSGQAKPFAFGDGRTRHQLILNGSPPLVRLFERNNYRAALIGYQRQRRALEEAEDQVAFSVRGELRVLRELAESYKIQERQVELSYLTVESSLETFQQPLPPGAPAGQSTAGNAAALTQQLLTAQQNLFQAQTQMTTIWITYLNTRLQLYRDMELMPLDFRGVWTDDVATCQCPPDGGRGAGAPDGTARPAGEGARQPERLPAPRPIPAPEGAGLEQPL
jgi:hypothetical protein